MADPEVTVPPPDPPDPPNPPPTTTTVTASSSNVLAPATAGRSREGETSSPSPNSSTSTPPWLRWSRGLNSLLDDPQGRDLFERYLEQEGCSAQLTFLWACDGLKFTALKDPPKIPQLVRSIYRHFIQNLNLLGLKEDTRSDLAQAIVDGRFSEIHIFDRPEAEILAHMKDNLFPNFLKSEIYLCAANGEEYSSSSLSASGQDGAGSSERRHSEGDEASMEAGESLRKTQQSYNAGAIDPITGEIIPYLGGDLSPGKVPSPPLSISASVQQALLPNQLQTVHEDKELSMSSDMQPPSSKFKLTKEALLATQGSRAVVLSGASKIRKSETAVSVGHYLTKHAGPPAPAPFPYHASYSSYNPVSRVDSEIQSLSSDAMTDDGAQGSHHSSRKHGHRPQHRTHCHNSNLPLQHHLQSERRGQQISGIPAGARVDNSDNLPPFPCNAGKVTAKGPNNPREAEVNPRGFAVILMRKLDDVKRQRELEDRLSKRISESDEHPQGAEAITPHVLAAAINRLQLQDEELPADILDKHMSRVFSDVTPTTRSPKLRSPTIGRRRGGGPPNVPGFSQRARRERDVVSTFSGDSGNVHDYPSDPSFTGMIKSRSIPYELKMQQDQGDLTSFGPGPSRGHHISRGGGMGHLDPRKVPLGMIKKTSSEFLDSGISVLSGATPTAVPPPSQPPPPGIPYDLSELRVREWMDQCGDERIRVGRSGTSPPSQRRVKKVGMSSSQMSAPLPPTTTLEEVRRRLTKKPPPLPSSALQSSVQMPLTLSPVAFSSSTLPRHHSPPSSDESQSTKECIPSVVIYEDSDVPFVLKIPKMKNRVGSGVTLSAFKDHLPKRGHYRYFFKTECAELDAKVVQEEVTEDSQELPLYEGRIFAHLQAATGFSGASIQLPSGMDK